MLFRSGLSLPPRRAFDPLATAQGHLHAPDRQRHVEPPAELLAELHPRVGMRAQAVMDMQRRKFAVQPRGAQPAQGVHQDDRVETTGKRDADAAAVRQPRCDETPENRCQGGLDRGLARSGRTRSARGATARQPRRIPAVLRLSRAAVP